MPGPAEQFSDFSSFWQQGDWVGDTRQDGACEAGSAHPVRSLRDLVEALGEGRQRLDSGLLRLCPLWGLPPGVKSLSLLLWQP